MTSRLEYMATRGEIDWTSLYFARFISAQTASELDDWTPLAAALLSESGRQGHVCVDLDDCAQNPLFREQRNGDIDTHDGADGETIASRLLLNPAVGLPGEKTPLIIDGRRLYLHRYWHYESRVAESIRLRLEADESYDELRAREFIDRFFGGSEAIDQDQIEATRCAASRRFCVISGGPGTGKTTTVAGIMALLLTLNRDTRIALAAPTGKAAARLSASIQQRSDRFDSDLASVVPQASTLHRLLGYGQRRYRYHRDNRLPFDCVIVDEASMIDLGMIYHLLQALPDSARLILLGDRDQLASVAAGNVLGDITGHGRSIERTRCAIGDAVALLEHNRRFDADGDIASLAQQVNRGDADRVAELLRRESASLRWHAPNTDRLDGQSLARVIDAYQPIFETDSVEAALDCYDATRVLTVINRGPFGVDEINRLVSAQLLERNGLPVSDVFHGMPVVVNRNHYDLDLYNGDTGILWQTEQGMRACFRDAESGIRQVRLGRLNDWDIAWATTVHKSQGSEFESVLLVLPTDADSEALNRELLYTAVTRAQHRFSLFASRDALNNCTRRLTRRHSGLAQRLGWPEISG